MNLVRVFGNVFLNPSCVGKIEFKVSFESGARTSTTTAYDVTGQHTLLTAQTVVSTSPSACERDPDGIRRDNHVHQEILAALREERDAKLWGESASDKVVICITGSQPQYDSMCEDSRNVIAHLYSFDVVKGSMSDAMAAIEGGTFRGLMGAIPTSTDGSFMLMELTDECDIQTGAEYDLVAGRLAPR